MRPDFGTGRALWLQLMLTLAPHASGKVTSAHTPKGLPKRPPINLTIESFVSCGTCAQIDGRDEHVVNSCEGERMSGERVGMKHGLLGPNLGSKGAARRGVLRLRAGCASSRGLRGETGSRGPGW